MMHYWCGHRFFFLILLLFVLYATKIAATRDFVFCIKIRIMLFVRKIPYLILHKKYMEGGGAAVQQKDSKKYVNNNNNNNK